MPGHKDHLMGGVAAFAVGMAVLHAKCPSTMVATEWAICALAGSLFPDVDIKSRGQYYFYHVIFGLLLLLSFQKRYDLLSIVSIGAIFPLLTKHRGLFHKWWFVTLLIYGVWYMISQQFPRFSDALWYDALFFLLGAISHLWLDLGFRRMMRI